ncbi:MAG: peptidase C11 [Firmicutes bacterium]|nr:peptidase C11 [Bacillota bacterium]
MDNRPTGRKKHVTGDGHGLEKRGSGLNTGPVGTGHGSNGGSGGGQRNSGGGLSKIIMLIILVIFGGAGGIGVLNNGSGGGEVSTGQDALGGMGSLFSVLSSTASNAAWSDGLNNTGKLITTVADGSRDKYTNIKGDGTDKVTIMVYMCGTDLESKYGMASNDLAEMAKASLNDNVNIIVYTGGCEQWKTSAISNRTNQIYKVANGGLTRLSENEGDKAMTDPNTLSGFIKYCANNYPANRNELIFWDHGGGSVTGYGYDQKHAASGSMTLAGIDKALASGGVKFDFIGFDACLMATAENALMLSKYGDYMIASEETEPGVGWYYTNWLTKLAQDTGMPTIEIGKNICDDFVATCAQQCRGQKTTLSVVDLAEAANTLPAAIKDFSTSTAALISDKKYAVVSNARSASREFAVSSKIDQVDLANLASNLGSEEGAALTQTILGAVKYNRTSSDMTNACGLSIYFPYRSAKMVDRIVNTYKQIGMDEEYSRCISGFAKMEVSGQAVSGGTTNPLETLLGQAVQSQAGQDVISQVLSSLVTGNVSSISGLDASNTNFLSDRSVVSDEQVEEYLLNNTLSDSDLVWADGKITLSEQQWELVQCTDKNMFIDDGDGFFDLGLDDVYTFDGKSLTADTDKTWLAVNGQIVAYYHTDTAGEGDGIVRTGYIPVILNGQRAKLIAVFEGEESIGYIAGAQYDYLGSDCEVEAKNLAALEDGDTLEFICDHYTYDGEYDNTYLIGQPMTVSGELELSDVNVKVGEAKITYMFTDIYGQKHWSTVLN